MRSEDARGLRKGCTRGAQGTYPGFTKEGCTGDAKGCTGMHRDARGMGKGCTKATREMHRRRVKDARGVQKGAVVDAQRHEGHTGMAGRMHAGCRRRADTFEDVVREQSGHLLVPLLHGKQD